MRCTVIDLILLFVKLFYVMAGPSFKISNINQQIEWISNIIFTNDNYSIK